MLERFKSTDMCACKQNVIICETWKDRMRGNHANSASHMYTQNTENKVEKLEHHNVYTGKTVSFDTAILFWLPCTQAASGKNSLHGVCTLLSDPMQSSVTWPLQLPSSNYTKEDSVVGERTVATASQHTHTPNTDVGSWRQVLYCHQQYYSSLEVVMPILPCKLEGQENLDSSTTSANMSLAAIGQ